MPHKIHDRQVAGRLLALKLLAYADRSDVLVLGLPRGGVPVAYEIAATLRLDLDVFVVQKLGVPGYEDLAMGALASGGVEIINPDVVEEFHLSKTAIADAVNAGQVEIRRRENVYRPPLPALDVRGRTVILVDDGIATGSTMRAAIEGIKRLGAARTVVAVGVAPLSTSLRLKGEADEVVSLLAPRDFQGVDNFYDEFPQLTDGDVCALLDEAQHRVRGAA